jgi:hypothetical protein
LDPNQDGGEEPPHDEILAELERCQAELRSGRQKAHRGSANSKSINCRPIITIEIPRRSRRIVASWHASIFGNGPVRNGFSIAKYFANNLLNRRLRAQNQSIKKLYILQVVDQLFERPPKEGGLKENINTM